jgi:hypothetical protein
MSEDAAEKPDVYNPSNPTPPAETPPLRSTAPQSEYTMTQVAIGFLILLLGVAVTFGLPIVLA